MSVTADYIRFVLVRNFLDNYIYVAKGAGSKRRKLEKSEGLKHKNVFGKYSGLRFRLRFRLRLRLTTEQVFYQLSFN